VRKGWNENGENAAQTVRRTVVGKATAPSWRGRKGRRINGLLAIAGKAGSREEGSIEDESLTEDRASK